MGFDEPVPADELPALLAELDGEGVSDDDYLGVVVFLVSHGAKVPPLHRARPSASPRRSPPTRGT